MSEAEELEPATVLAVAGAELDRAPLAAENVVSGAPIEGHRLLAMSGDVAVGIWELSHGVARDVESDEVFVVVAGKATVEIAARDGWAASTLELQPGSVVRLVAGMHTVWIIHETIRKFYVSL
ncbi:MAG: cupin domain-containing protein [Pseudolysinimonas sp.]